MSNKHQKAEISEEENKGLVDQIEAPLNKKEFENKPLYGELTYEKLEQFLKDLEYNNENKEEKPLKIQLFKNGKGVLYKITCGSYTMITGEAGKEEFLVALTKEGAKQGFKEIEKLLKTTGVYSNPNNRGPKTTKPKKKRKNGKRRK